MNQNVQASDATATSVEGPQGGARLRMFVEEIEALRRDTQQKVGILDEGYIRRVVRTCAALHWASRALIIGGAWFTDPVSVAIGILGLAVSLVIENMEIGHNVMHGQYDFMNDPKINSRDYEWNSVVPSSHWKNSHNIEHHNNTNVIQRDYDFGFGHFRLSSYTRWLPVHRVQLFTFVWLTLSFQHSTALHDARTFEYLSPPGSRPEMVQPRPGWAVFFTKMREYLGKASRHMTRDYVFFPLLAGPHFLTVLLANLVARGLANIWECLVIFCGHFSEKSFVFEPKYGGPDESVGSYYLRQVAATCNLTGSSLFHMMTGHLSYHIEHHIFPDVPAHRYPEIAARLKAICARYEVPYLEERMVPQVLGVVKRLIKYSSPHPVDEPLGLRLSALLDRVERSGTVAHIADRPEDAATPAFEGGTVTCERSGRTIATDGSRSILETLESAGLEPAFGCRKGRCHTCTCRKRVGRVFNTRTGLETEGEELIQICISRPLGDITLDV
jgi:fatty acid desaturase/ferredoxin